MFQSILHTLPPILAPVRFVLAWGLLFLIISNVWRAVHDIVAQAKRMHQIPCSKCRFFTGDYHLKCTVHPDIALSETAINCSDYHP